MRKLKFRKVSKQEPERAPELLGAVNEACPEFGGAFTLDTLHERRNYSVAIGPTDSGTTPVRVMTGQFLRDNFANPDLVFHDKFSRLPTGFYRLAVYEGRYLWVRPWARILDNPRPYRVGIGAVRNLALKLKERKTQCQ